MNEDTRMEWFKAVNNNNLDKILSFINENINPDIRQIDEEDSTALMIASRKGYKDMVHILLDDAEADIKIQGRHGVNAFMIACIYRHSDIVNLLLDAGVDPNIQDHEGYTALMYASEQGHVDIVHILLQEYVDADPNIQTNEGYTALMYASIEGYSDIVQLLLEGGAEPNIQDDEGYTALIYASEQGHVDIVHSLLQEHVETDPNIQTNDKSTALIYASINEYSDIVQLLLENCADPDIQDDEGYTALIYASKNGYSDIVQLLFEADAEPDIQTNEGYTALIYASENRYSDIVQLLLEEDADPNLADDFGKSPLYRASVKGYKEIETLLSDAIFTDTLVPVLGTCYDLIELENINATNYIKKKKKHILLIKENEVICWARVRNICYIKRFYECKEASGFIPLENVIRDTIYVKFGPYNNFISETDFKKTHNKNFTIFVIRPTEQILTAVVSIKVADKGGSWVSADHCQAGSGDTLYTLDAYSLEEGKHLLPKQNNNEKKVGGRLSKRWKSRKQKRRSNDTKIGQKISKKTKRNRRT